MPPPMTSRRMERLAWWEAMCRKTCRQRLEARERERLPLWCLEDDLAAFDAPQSHRHKGLLCQEQASSRLKPHHSLFRVQAGGHFIPPRLLRGSKAEREPPAPVTLDSGFCRELKSKPGPSPCSVPVERCEPRFPSLSYSFKPIAETPPSQVHGCLQGWGGGLFQIG